jgi:16S rRNA (cytosine967-C5)-methyltransferase
MKWKPEYDLILCDAPCSGTGTLARNPEIRYRLNEGELERQHGRQVAILSSLMRGLKPGGRLLYSTCSLEPEENEAVVYKCLDQQNDFELVRLEGEVDRLEREEILLKHGATKLRETALIDGCLRTLPGVHECDGFFAALLTRQA